jgi:multicomponent Na+:H+ antiporter subunit E
MSFALLTVLLALGWAAASGTFTLLNVLFGAAIGVAAPRLARRLRRVLTLAGLFAFELVLSAAKVAFLVIRPDMHRTLTPGIVAFPLTVKRDAEIAILANMITLTPGTLSVDVSQDRRYLFIHVLDMKDRDEVIRSIAEGFERRVAEVFR